MAKRIPTQDEVRRLFEYDAERGVLIWRLRQASDFTDGKYSAQRIANTFNKISGGKVAGTMRNGYRYININRTGYYAHKLIWLYVKNGWPEEIDHERGSANGDRIEYLREVSHSENMKNVKLRSDNKSGVVGVVLKGRKWCAQIKVNGEHIWLGDFCEKSDAAQARKVAERKYGFHENHGRKSD